ncbi:hypothetical protein J596_0308 [Acinetobacter baumannii 21072]|uniref:Uncharacterized protein n=1 Tax=Acinetobacter baumannii 21072 TaxID=1310697 RepID=A0A062IS70_ACIBA|nr:hypothetical protein J596_0308 [Acinetobacter baumannii 21072]
MDFISLLDHQGVLNSVEMRSRLVVVGFLLKKNNYFCWGV